MIPYDKAFSTEIIYGEGRHHEVGERVKEYSDNILLVYGGGSIKKTGLYDDVVSSLNKNGVHFTELGGVRSNPDVSLVRDGIDIVRKNNIDFLLAVGGGSVIDTAKAIGVGVYYDGDVWDLFSGTEIKKMMKVGTVLTIPGTGTEASFNIVLSNSETKQKIGLGNKHCRCTFSILDPTLCVTIPQKVIAAPVFDMLSHTMERYFSETPHADVVDGIAEGIMRGIIKNGLAAYRNPKDVDAWGELMIGADFSHNGISGFGKQGDWANHPMEEVVSGEYPRIAHGDGLSVITLAWMKYVYKKHLAVFDQFAVNVMGCHVSYKEPEALARQGIEALEDFCHKMNLPTSMKQLGVPEDQFKHLAEKCANGGTVGSLEKLTAQDIENIYRLANK